MGLSAAIYRDPDLLKMFNTGDVYSAMAQKFFADQLTSEDLELPSREFKAKHKDLRNQMKTCTLALIYGTTAYGLARQVRYPKNIRPRAS